MSGKPPGEWSAEEWKNRLHRLRLPLYLIEASLENISPKPEPTIPNMVNNLSSEELEDIYWRYRYAGICSIQIVYGFGLISPLEKLETKISDAFKKYREEKLEPKNKENDIVYEESVIREKKLFIHFRTRVGSAITEDPKSGSIQESFKIEYPTLVFRENSELVEIRASHSTSQTYLKEILSEYSRFGEIKMEERRFVDTFKETLNKITSATVRMVDASEQKKAELIKLKSPLSSSGGRMDMRTLVDYQQYMEDGGIDTTLYGYIVYGEGGETRFLCNFQDARFSFRKFASEEELDELVKVVERVVEETGVRPAQRELYDFLRVS